MKYSDRAFAEIEEAVKNTPDSEVSPQAKKHIAEKVEEIKEKHRSPLDTDKWIYRLVVIFLGLAVLAGLAFTFILSLRYNDPNVSIEIPEIF